MGIIEYNQLDCDFCLILFEEKNSVIQLVQRDWASFSKIAFKRVRSNAVVASLSKGLPK